MGRKFRCIVCDKEFIGNVNKDCDITCGRCVAIKIIKYANRLAKEASEVTEKPIVEKVVKKRQQILKVCKCGAEFKARSSKEIKCLACKRGINNGNQTHNT